MVGGRRQAPRRADHARRLRPGMAGAVRAGGGPDPVGPRAIASSRSTTPARRRCRASRRSRSSTSPSSSPTHPTSRPTSRTWRRPATGSWIREPDWYEHRVFKGPDTNINLHTFSPGCQEIERMVGFRDWLRTHPDDRDLYERTKRELVDADLGLRPELRRREDRGRRGDRGAGRAAAAGRLSRARPVAVRREPRIGARVDSRLGGGYRPRHAHEPLTSTFDARHDRSRFVGPETAGRAGRAEVETSAFLFDRTGRINQRCSS